MKESGPVEPMRPSNITRNAEAFRQHVSSDHLGEVVIESVHELHDREHRGHAEAFEHQLRSFACARLHCAESE